MYANERELKYNNIEEPKWFRLDNAAKIYPVVSGPHNGHVFRISFYLKSEIIPEVLQQATIDCKPRFPTFYVRMRKGFFWYYYEVNDKTPEVKPEPPHMCKPIDLHNNNGYHFTCYYYKNRISMEVFHSICDGYGAMEFTKALVFRYLELIGNALDSENIVLTCKEKPNKAETDDSFLNNYDAGHVKRLTVEKAYKIVGTPFLQGGTGLITGKISTADISKLAKEKGVSVTQYLSALLAYSIIQTGDNKKLYYRPVNIFVPVNVRKYYNSKTLRNFSLYFYSTFRNEGKNFSFDEVLLRNKNNFSSELTANKLRDTLNANVAVEKNIAIKCCPLAIKRMLFKAGYMIHGKRLTTSTISNLGNISLPATMESLIEDIEVSLGAGYNTGPNAALVSYNGITSVAFSRGIRETAIEQFFFSFLGNQGIRTVIKSNFWEKY